MDNIQKNIYEYYNQVCKDPLSLAIIGYSLLMPYNAFKFFDNATNNALTSVITDLCKEILQKRALFGSRTEVRQFRATIKNMVRFNQVAINDKIKEELMEIVDFFKHPEKFSSLGARMPKGILLSGPPGSGKTQLARAIAGELDCPFFYFSGPEFQHKYFGESERKIRNAFHEAKKNTPSIIFFDEIDAIGQTRSSSSERGDKHYNTLLTQLLTEMDGFEKNENLIVIATTNRPQVLDPALLRSGRFDRKMVIDLPNQKTRHEILQIHASKIKIDPSVDLQQIAHNTEGLSGADLENILNESAIHAVRKGLSFVTLSEIEEACEKICTNAKATNQSSPDFDSCLDKLLCNNRIRTKI